MVAAPTIELTEDTGSSASDGITSQAGLRGTADPNASVSIFQDGWHVGTVVADAFGQWSLDPNPGDGSFSYTATASDGEETSDASAPLNVTVDATAPTVSVSFAEGSDASLDDAGNEATLVLTFDAEVSDLSAEDLDVTGGHVHSLAAVPGEDGKVWTAVFEADESDDLGTLGASVSVKAGIVSDAAGNANAASNAALFYGDTAAPDAPTLSLETDTGTPGDGATAQAVLTGTGTPGSYLTIFQASEGGEPQALASFYVDESGTWSLDLANYVTENVAYTYTASATDFTNTAESADSVEVAYTGAAPSVSIAFADGSGHYLNAATTTAGLVFTFTEPVSDFALDDLDIVGGTVTDLASSDGGLTWTATFTADESDDIGALGASVTVRAGAVADGGGSENEASNTVPFYGDTKPVDTPTIALQTDTGAPGDGVTAQAVLTGTGTPGSYLTLYQTAEGGAPQALTSLYVGEDGTWSVDLAGYVSADVPYTYTASATDFTNGSGTSDAVGVTYSGAAPSVSIAFADGSGHYLNAATTTAGLVITFTEPVSDFALDDLDIVGGTVTDLVSGDGGLTWTATFTADESDDIGALGASVTVRAGAVADGGGSENEASNTVPFYGDTKPVDTPTIALQTDTGAPGDGVTAQAVLTGTGTPGSYLTIYQTSEGGEPQALTSVHVAEDGTWSIDLAGSVTENVSYSYTATATDFTNTSPSSDGVEVAYSGAAPSVSIGFADGSGYYLDAGTPNAGLVFTFSEPVTDFALDDLDIVGGTVTDLVSSDGGLTWTATFTADESDDLGALGASVTVKAGAVADGGGSENEASNTIGFYGDTDAPATPTLRLLTDTGEPGDGATTVGVLAGEGTPGSTVVIYQADEGGDPVYLSQTTVSENGTWSFDLEGTVPTGEAHTYTATASDGTNTTPATAPLQVTLIDAVEPSAPSIGGVSEDTGYASWDGVTKDTTPIVSGTAEAGATIEVFLGGTSIGTTTTDENGQWSLPYAGDPLPDGSYAITATATDEAGNTSDLSYAFPLTIDTDADEGGALSLAIADPDIEDGDLSAVVVQVSGIDPDALSATVTFTDGTGHTAEVQVWNGTHSVNLHDLGFGENSTITSSLTVTDYAGNTAVAAGAAIEVGEDATAPSAPAIYGISDDSGYGYDGVTNDATPGIYGHAESGSTVEVFIDGTSIGTATADSSGNWTVPHSGDPLAQGSHAVTATATDASGNTSPASTAFPVTIDTVADADGDLGLTVGVSPLDDDNLDHVTVGVSGLDADAVSAVVTFEDQNGHSATLSVVPGENDIDLEGYGFGVGSVITTSLTATDQAGNTATASGGDIVVDNSNEPPALTADTASAGENETVTIDVLANDSDPDGGTLTLVSVSAPFGQGSASVADGKVVFNPGTAFDHLKAGETAEVTLTYSVEDDKGADSTSTITLTIAGAKEPIEAYDGTTETPQDLVEAILAPDSGITIDPDSIVLTGATGQTSIYDGSVTGLGIGAGILLTSGTTPGTANTSTGFGRSQGGGGDADLTAVVGAVYSGNTATHDANVLSFSFTVTDPNIKSVSFDALFGSEEFPEYVDSYVDAAAVLVNGVNYAYFNKDADNPLSVLTRNLSNFISNADGHLPIEYDGVSKTLTISAPVHVGVNTIKIAIADTGDSVLDSGLFISNLRGTTATGSGGISLPGENDAPFLGPNVDAAADEKGSNADTGTIDLDGSITLEDADPEDEHVVAVTDSSSAGGPVLGTLEVAVAAGGDAVTWAYSVDAAAVAYLAAGETRVETFTVTVSDREAGGLTDTVTITVTITGSNDGPKAVADIAAGGEHQSLTIDVLGNDTDADHGAVLTLLSASAPDGEGAASVLDGKVVFTPGTDFDHLAEGETAEIAVTYLIKDEHGAQSTGTVTVTVTGTNDGPVATADEAEGGENETITLDVLANDTDADHDAVLTLTGVSAPDGQGMAEVVDGKVVFTPGTDFDQLTAGETAEVVLTYTVEDEFGAQSEATVTVTITGGNDAIVVAGGDLSADYDEPESPSGIDTISGVIDFTDADLPSTHTVTVVGTTGNTAGVTFAAEVHQNASGNDVGQIGWSAEIDTAVIDGMAEGETRTLTYTLRIADDQGNTVDQDVTVTLTGTNDAPVAEADEAEGGENETITLDVLANDTDADHGAILALTGVSAPDGQGMAEVVDGKVVFTPGTDFDQLTEGEAAEVVLTYTVEDEFGAESEATVTVTVTGTNDAIVVAGGDLAAEYDEPETPSGTDTISGVIDFTDADLPSTHTVTVVGTSGNTAGVTFAAEVNQNASGNDVGQIGWSAEIDTAVIDGMAEGETRTLTYTLRIADDQGNTIDQDVTVTLNGTNDAPIAEADDAAGGENETLAIDVLANDSDADTGDSLTLVDVSGPGGEGSASVKGGKVKFNPGADFDHLAQGETAEVVLTYTVRDESGTQTQADVVVTVTGANDAPVAMADEAEGDENETLTLDVLANDADADDGAVLALVGASAPAGKGTVSIVAGKLVFNPGTAFDHLEEGETEEVTLTYRTQDEHGAQATGVVVVILKGSADGPIVSGEVDGGSHGENTATFAVNLLGKSVDPSPPVALTVSDLAFDVESGEWTDPIAHTLTNGVLRINPSQFNSLSAGETLVVVVNYTVANESGEAPASARFVIQGANDAPTGLTVSNKRVDENAAAATLVGTLGAVDADRADSFTYTLAEDASGFFDIVGDRLVVAAGAALDFETATFHMVKVLVTDSAGATRTVDVRVDVRNLNGVTIDGTAGADVISATSSPPGKPRPTQEDDTVNAGAGNDTVQSLGGNDTVNGGTGDDTLKGGAGKDTIDGGAGKDTLNGDAGDDTFVVRGTEASTDTISGGLGTDHVKVLGASAVTLAKFDATAASIEVWEGNNRQLLGTSGANDIDLSGLTAVTKLTFVDGAAGNDALVGSAFDDDLRGGAGNDSLNGGLGEDILAGGLGKDALIGGGGADMFDFDSLQDSVVGANRDSVTFVHADGDRIDLLGIDADTDATAGNQAFKWVNAANLGAAFTGVDGQLRFANGILSGDTDGDKKADFEIRITGSLLSADVIL